AADLLVGLQLLPELVGFVFLLAQALGDLFHLGALGGELLGGLALLLAQPFQPGAQGGEHGLLALQRLGALGGLGAGEVEFGLLLGEALLLGAGALLGGVELAGLFLQFAAVALHLLVALVGLAGALLQQFLAALELGPGALEAGEVFAELGLALLQGLA